MFPGHELVDIIEDAAAMAWQDNIENATKIRTRMSYMRSGGKITGVLISVRQMDGERNRIEMSGTLGDLVAAKIVEALDQESSLRHRMTVPEARALRVWITKMQEENARAEPARTPT